MKTRRRYRRKSISKRRKRKSTKKKRRYRRKGTKKKKRRRRRRGGEEKDKKNTKKNRTLSRTTTFAFPSGVSLAAARRNVSENIMRPTGHKLQPKDLQEQQRLNDEAAAIERYAREPHKSITRAYRDKTHGPGNFSGNDE